MIVSPIKIQGKKTKLLPHIQKIMPSLDNTLYIEPFLGSGEVLFNINPEYALVGDNNGYVINFFNALQSKEITPEIVRKFLEENGKKLEEYGKEFYYEMRLKLNSSHYDNPLYFLFVNRSCFNGLMRFNCYGDFNVPFCNKENRFSKAYITKIVNQVEKVQNIILSHGSNWKFVCGNWRSLELYDDFKLKNKFFYFDPPYIDRNTTYFDPWTKVDNDELFSFISFTKDDFVLSNWLSNDYRENTYIKDYFGNKKFTITPIEHFYYVGGKENNRHSVVECLVTNMHREE